MQGMPRTTVHLMRHGEVHNPEGVLYGRLAGYNLSERGRAMAESVAEHLAGHDLRAVLASPLERAQQSAAPTAARFDLPIHSEAGLIEAGNDFEGAVLRQRIVLAHPRYWRRYINPFKPSWGEPYTDIAARMQGAIDRALELLPDGGEALLVSHQLPIWIARLSATGRRLAHDPRRRECALASLTSLDFEGKELVGVRYSEPAADLVAGAHDMTPGTSSATLPEPEGE